MWLIPGKTKLHIEIFKGIGIADVLIGMAAAFFVALIFLSNIPFRIVFAVIVGLISIFLLLRIDEEPNYMLFLHILRHFSIPRHYAQEKVEQHKKAKDIDDIIAFTGIADDLIEYGGQYYGAVLEIPPVEFRLFSRTRKNNTIINGLGKVLRSINPDFAANIVKIERPMHYEKYRENEVQKLADIRKSYEKGMLSEEELQSRVEVIYDRINELDSMMDENKVIVPFYYIVLYDSDKRQLENLVDSSLNDLDIAEIHARRLTDKEIAVFLKYTNEYDVNEAEIEDVDPDLYASWAMPQSVDMNVRTTEIDGLVTHFFKINKYPVMASDAWLATVMTMPGTKVVVKCKPMDISKSIIQIDKAIAEIQAQYNTTGVESKKLSLEQNYQSLNELLSTLQGDNETLLQTNIYVTAYDIVTTENSPKLAAPEDSLLPRINNMKKRIRRTYSEQGFKLVGMDFNQVNAFIASQVSAFDPFAKDGRGIPGNSVAAAYPWVFANISDEHGIHLGSSDNVPVFIDFFTRNSERVNSNMVIVGKSGSGKSYATKTLLANMAADNSKIFILDPENEYSELAYNLHGKFINVGNAQTGRLNPFQIMTVLSDDEEDTEGGNSTESYAAHLQFLEEFFKQILADCDKDALEYLNSIIDRMYIEHGITAETDLSKLSPEDYPVFDDLYDAILLEFQQTDNDFIRSMLRILMNYIAKFSAGGRNANIWNGPSTVSTDENFCVFNFQTLLANRNGSVANAQMLLVLKYIDNEIIKNRDYNTKYHTNRKIVVVIDEAHVFIDTKFPAALDFMFQLAKRIRKYNGMQIVITQNIKDFVGSEEIARKSGAIINACQYSFIFSLAPNDMDDLCKLYEKAGGINEVEQEKIVSAPRGQAFTIIGPTQRTTFQVEASNSVVSMFSEKGFESQYFVGDVGAGYWEEFIGPSRQAHNEEVLAKTVREIQEEREKKNYVNFTELEGDDINEAIQKAQKTFIDKKNKLQGKADAYENSLNKAQEDYYSAAEADDQAQAVDEFDDFDIPEIPEDPEQFKKMMAARKESAALSGQEETSEVLFSEEDEETGNLIDQEEEEEAFTNLFNDEEESEYEPEPVSRSEYKTQRQENKQDNTGSSNTEQLLMQILAGMSRENMDLKIQQAVSNEVNKRVDETLASMGISAGTAAVAGATGAGAIGGFAAGSIAGAGSSAAAGILSQDEDYESDSSDEENSLSSLFSDSSDNEEENEGEEEGSEDGGFSLSGLFSGDFSSDEEEDSEESEEESSEEEEDSSDFSLGSLFGSFDDEEEAEEETESKSEEEEEEEEDDDDDLLGLLGLGGGSSDDDDDDDSFDIAALLSQQAEEMEETSVIEQMELYDEMVIDITVEDLMLYAKNLAKARQLEEQQAAS